MGSEMFGAVDASGISCCPLVPLGMVNLMLQPL
jgi:hypothetical protein